MGERRKERWPAHMRTCDLMGLHQGQLAQHVLLCSSEPAGEVRAQPTRGGAGRTAEREDREGCVWRALG